MRARPTSACGARAVSAAMQPLRMLNPDWQWTPLVLWFALALVLALLIARTALKDRRRYARFKLYRTTAKRQATYRMWLRDSFVSIGGTAVVILLLAGAYIAPLVQELTTWPVVRDLRGVFIHDTELAVSVLVAGLVGLGVLTVVGIFAARKDKEVPTIGDIAAMLPRNRQELRLGALLSINAGVVEELLFRLALPALIFGATGSAIAAVVASVLLFGAMHVYQGVAGIVGTTIGGAVFMLLYAVTGTIVVPILVHALFDLRSLVLIPVAVYGVHKVDGSVVRVSG